MLKNLEDECYITKVISAPYMGVCFDWTAQNVGFGEFSFFRDLETNRWTCNSECMSREFVKKMLCHFVDNMDFVDEPTDVKEK